MGFWWGGVGFWGGVVFWGWVGFWDGMGFGGRRRRQENLSSLTAPLPTHPGAEIKVWGTPSLDFTTAMNLPCYWLRHPDMHELFLLLTCMLSIHNGSYAHKHMLCSSVSKPLKDMDAIHPQLL